MCRVYTYGNYTTIGRCYFTDEVVVGKNFDNVICARLVVDCEGTRGVLPFQAPLVKDTSVVYDSNNHDGLFLIEFVKWNCEYCHINEKNFSEMSKKFPNVETIEIINDYQSNASKWYQKYKPTWPLLWDKNGELTEKFNVYGVPATFIVDKNGNIIYRTSGVWNSITKQEIDYYLKSHYH